MVNGLHLCSACLNSSHSERFTILPHIHPFIDTCTHRRRCQTRKATASSSGAVRERCLAQGNLDTLGGARDQRLPDNMLYLLNHMPPSNSIYKYLSLLYTGNRLVRESDSLTMIGSTHTLCFPQRAFVKFLHKQKVNLDCHRLWVKTTSLRVFLGENSSGGRPPLASLRLIGCDPQPHYSLWAVCGYYW